MCWADNRDRYITHEDRQRSESYRIDDPLTGGIDPALFTFLSMPLHSSDGVFERFAGLDGAICRADKAAAKERFIYVPGTRPDRALLVAHADTVFDEEYGNLPQPHTLHRCGDMIHGSGSPIGADDRAGCAMLWHMRASGHSLLITDGEEAGGIGSRWLMQENEDIAREINAHSFMVQLDRKNGADFKTYDVGTQAFKDYIAEETGFTDAGSDCFTDICLLSRELCGVNFSVGYYAPHTDCEYLNYREWIHSLRVVRSLLDKPLARFTRY